MEFPFYNICCSCLLLLISLVILSLYFSTFLLPSHTKIIKSRTLAHFLCILSRVVGWSLSNALRSDFVSKLFCMTNPLWTSLTQDYLYSFYAPKSSIIVSWEFVTCHSTIMILNLFFRIFSNCCFVSGVAWPPYYPWISKLEISSPLDCFANVMDVVNHESWITFLFLKNIML